MSAVILTSIGQSVGGPLGALTGSLVGRVADRALDRFGSQANNMAWADQTASYGAVIPRIFGRMRTAGIVLWAQPMRRSGGGKGGGQRSYVTSVAIALSARSAIGIGRIWADGREIRDQESKSEFPIDLRFHAASANGGADPLIAAAEGLARAPAYCGLSYVVLEDFPLGPFGNRIPVLEFELIADEREDGPSTVPQWVSELSGEPALAGADPDMLTPVGWAVGAGQLRQDLSAIMRVSGMVVGEQSGALVVGSSNRVHHISDRDAVMRDGKCCVAAMRSNGATPVSAAVSYADPARDYLAGDQQVFQQGQGAPVRLDLPMALAADDARTLATSALREQHGAPHVLSVRLPIRFLGIAVGDRIQLAGRGGTWNVVSRIVENAEIQLECTAVPAKPAKAPSDAGRVVGMPVVATSARRLAIIELPVGLGALPAVGIVAGVAASDAWSGAELHVDDGGQILPIGFQRDPLVGGVLATVLAFGPVTIWDEANHIELILDEPGNWLEARTRAAVLAGANLVWCGGELVQFRNVTAVGPGILRLSGLLRGRMGTMPPAAGHAAGSNAWVLDATRLRPHPIGPDSAGRPIQVMAVSGSGTVDATHVFQSVSHAPLSPCHVAARRTTNGDLHVSWINRDRKLLNWSAEEPALPGSQSIVEVWRAGERLLHQMAAGRFVTISAEAQIEASGELFGAVDVRVLAAGVGPSQFRASAFVSIH